MVNARRVVGVVAVPPIGVRPGREERRGQAEREDRAAMGETYRDGVFIPPRGPDCPARFVATGSVKCVSQGKAKLARLHRVEMYVVEALGAFAGQPGAIEIGDIVVFGVKHVENVH